jgi:archaellum component FlaC
VDAELRAYLDQRFDAVDQQLGAVDRQLGAVDQRFGAVDQRFDAVDQRFDAVDRRFDAVDGRFVSLEAELRRHFGVLIEDVRHDLRAVAEMVVANTEAIVALRRRLDAR